MIRLVGISSWVCFRLCICCRCPVSVELVTLKACVENHVITPTDIYSKSVLQLSHEVYCGEKTKLAITCYVINVNITAARFHQTFCGYNF